MSAFSYTAPIFTEEQEREEAASITEEEQNSIRSDVFGVHTLIEETSDLLASSMARFAEEIAAIPEDEKRGYTIALERCPRVFDREASPMRFLRAENYDGRLAAIRVAKYWECRLNVFGPERAFLPIVVDDSMEESMRCYRILFDGNYLLPHDNNGRAVYFMNKSSSNIERMRKGESLQILWYNVHAALEVESVQKAGFVLLVNMKITLPNQFNRALLRSEILHVRDVLPIKIRAVHICYTPTFVNDLIFPIVKFLLGKRLRQRLTVHLSNTLPDEMIKYGFTAADLPVSFGGTYKYDQAQRLEASTIFKKS